jgi:hypothetical protein
MLPPHQPVADLPARLLRGGLVVLIVYLGAMSACVVCFFIGVGIMKLFGLLD